MPFVCGLPIQCSMYHEHSLKIHIQLSRLHHRYNKYHIICIYLLSCGKNRFKRFWTKAVEGKHPGVCYPRSSCWWTWSLDLPAVVSTYKITQTRQKNFSGSLSTTIKSLQPTTRKSLQPKPNTKEPTKLNFTDTKKMPQASCRWAPPPPSSFRPSPPRIWWVLRRSSSRHQPSAPGSACHRLGVWSQEILGKTKSGLKS